ncbi:hypothetical protein S7335_5004 [Synechococcus sp. PCC 7335]|nr:hypothetical protein S7335_5004 [Synechococcus sp. PCC 7335]
MRSLKGHKLKSKRYRSQISLEHQVTRITVAMKCIGLRE